MKISPWKQELQNVNKQFDDFGNFFLCSGKHGSSDIYCFFIKSIVLIPFREYF